MHQALKATTYDIRCGVIRPVIEQFLQRTLLDIPSSRFAAILSSVFASAGIGGRLKQSSGAEMGLPRRKKLSDTVSY